MANTASSAPAMATRSKLQIGFSSWRGFTPLPAVIRLRMAKIAPAINEKRRGKARREPSPRNADSMAKEASASELARADLAQHLPAVEFPHRNEIGDIEERRNAGERGEHACRGGPHRPA